jgi:hypothetical protein
MQLFFCLRPFALIRVFIRVNSRPFALYFFLGFCPDIDFAGSGAQ